MRRACPRTTVHVCHLQHPPQLLPEAESCGCSKDQHPSSRRAAKGLFVFCGPTWSELGNYSPGLGTDKDKEGKQRQECDLGEKGPLNWGPEMWSQEQTLRSPLLKALGTSPLPGTETKCRCTSAAHRMFTPMDSVRARSGDSWAWAGRATRTAGQEVPPPCGFSIGDLGQAGTGLPRMLIPSSD